MSVNGEEMMRGELGAGSWELGRWSLGYPALDAGRRWATTTREDPYIIVIVVGGWAMGGRRRDAPCGMHHADEDERRRLRGIDGHSRGLYPLRWTL